MRSVLIIDDDRKLIELLQEYLVRFEMEVSAATNPDEGLRLLRQKKPDLVILDVMLPGKSGFEVCKEIRAESTVPVIMLTARGEVTDRVVGLELGADDYMPKPFEPRELVARMQSIWRRANERRRLPELRFGALRIDPEARRATLDGEALDLTTAEFDLLQLLASHPGKAFDRDALIDGLKGENWETYHRSIDVLMSRLRQKLKDNPKKPVFIRTIWGTGYMFVARPDGD